MVVAGALVNRWGLLPSVAVIIWVVDDTVVYQENPAFVSDDAITDIASEHGFPSLTFVLRAKQNYGMAVLDAEQITLGIHTPERTWKIQGFPNVLRFKDAAAAEAEDEDYK